MFDYKKDILPILTNDITAYKIKIVRKNSFYV